MILNSVFLCVAVFSLVWRSPWSIFYSIAPLFGIPGMLDPFYLCSLIHSLILRKKQCKNMCNTINFNKIEGLHKIKSINRI